MEVKVVPLRLHQAMSQGCADVSTWFVCIAKLQIFKSTRRKTHSGFGRSFPFLGGQNDQQRNRDGK